MSIDRILPDGVSPHPMFTPVVKAGPTVYIAGQVARDVAGNLVGRGDIDAYQREEGKKALASAEALAKQAGVSATVHIGVGRQGAIISDFVRKLGAGLVVMGTRGHTGLAGVLLGSVAQDIIAHIDVPVTLVK